MSELNIHKFEARTDCANAAKLQNVIGWRKCCTSGCCDHVFRSKMGYDVGKIDVSKPLEFWSDLLWVIIIRWIIIVFYCDENVVTTMWSVREK